MNQTQNYRIGISCFLIFVICGTALILENQTHSWSTFLTGPSKLFEGTILAAGFHIIELVGLLTVLTGVLGGALCGVLYCFSFPPVGSRKNDNPTTDNPWSFWAPAAAILLAIATWQVYSPNLPINAERVELLLKAILIGAAIRQIRKGFEARKRFKDHLAKFVSDAGLTSF